MDMYAVNSVYMPMYTVFAECLGMYTRNLRVSWCELETCAYSQAGANSHYEH